MKKYILEDFLKVYDERSYLTCNKDVKKAVERKSFSSGKEHFIKNGYEEIKSGNRGLYVGLPKFNEASYLLKFPDVKDKILRKEFLSPFHHYLMTGYREKLNSKRIERLHEVNTFSYEAVFVDFTADLLRGLPQARFIKIVFANPASIEIKKFKIFTNNDDQNLIVGKKVYFNNDLVVLSMEASSSISTKHSKVPTISIDFDNTYELTSLEFELEGANIGMKSNFTISVSEDSETWHDVFITTKELSLRRIQSKLLRISNFLQSCQNNQIEVISFRGIDEQEFKYDLLCKSFSEITQSLIGVTANRMSVRNNRVTEFNSNDLKMLEELKKKLQANFTKLPQTLEFTAKKNKPFELLLESFNHDEMILALPKGIEKKDIYIQLFSNDAVVEYEMIKISFSDDMYDACRNLLIERGETNFNNYNFWKLDLSTFNKFRFDNISQKVLLSHAWYILEVKKPYNELSILYRHGDVVRIYKELLLCLNIFLERDMNDLVQIMIIDLLEGSFARLFKLARNYQLDFEPNTVEIENLHKYVELVTTANILSGKKIFTRHGVFQSLLDKNPELLSKTMRDVEVIFSDLLQYQCMAFYGTLLGIVRDKDFIAHDDDVDMLYLGKANSFEEMLIERKIIIDKLKENGIKISNVFDGGDYNIHLNVNGRNMDIFASYKNEENEYCFFAGGKIVSVKVTSFLPLKEVTFYNQILKIPNHPEDILVARYGQDWNIPNKNFGFVRKTKNNKYFLL